MHHLIFEGAELAGKSWLMSQVYDHLEPKYNKNKVTLDGCHWFNCDIGFYGTKHAKSIIKHYSKIFEELKNKNLIIEKFYISDIIYSRLHKKKEVNYKSIERKLSSLEFKIILITFPTDVEVLKKRIQDRLNIYPHYERILRDPNWYIAQQNEYLDEIKKTKLPYLIIQTDQLPDPTLVKKILDWIGE